MREMLKKYLSSEAYEEVKAKYIADNPEAKDLPVHISKSRLDEVLAKNKEAEKTIKDLQTAAEASQATLTSSIEEAVKKANEESKKLLDEQLAAKDKDFAITEAVYKAKGRNVRAIKALIDPEKPIDEEIVRLQKDEAYLFGNEGDLPDGTGKKENQSQTDEDKESARMRQAVGIFR